MQRDIRCQALRMLGRQTDQCPVPEPPPQHEISQFSKTKRGGPSINDFRLDLEGTNRSTWNKKASQVFAQAFLATDLYAPRDPQSLVDAFQTHIITIKSHYSKQTGRINRLQASHAKQIASRKMRFKTVRFLRIVQDAFTQGPYLALRTANCNRPGPSGLAQICRPVTTSCWWQWHERRRVRSSY